MMFSQHENYLRKLKVSWYHSLQRYTIIIIIIISALINHQRVTTRKEAVWVRINVETIKTNKLIFL